MTATTENSAAGGGRDGTGLVGQVARVTGPVVDVEFGAEQMPDIYNALHVDVTLGDSARTLTLEVALHVPTASLKIEERWGIHRDAPAFDQLEPRTEILETGIKVLDLLTPYVKGGKVGLFGGAGVGKTVLIQEMITRVAR